MPSNWTLASIIKEGEGKFKLEERTSTTPVESCALVETYMIQSPLIWSPMISLWHIHHHQVFQGNFSTLVCSALLPLAYKLNPDLVLLRWYLLISKLKTWMTSLFTLTNKINSRINLKQAVELIKPLQRGRGLSGGQMIHITNSQNILLIIQIITINLEASSHSPPSEMNMSSREKQIWNTGSPNTGSRQRKVHPCGADIRHCHYANQPQPIWNYTRKNTV